MNSFIWIFSLSFCFGRLPLFQKASTLFEKTALRRLLLFLCGVAAGTLVVWSAHCLVGTPVSEALAATGLILGQTLFFRRGRREEDLRGIMTGVFLVFAPVVLPFLAVTWLFWYRLTRRPALSSFLASPVLVPLNLITRQSDIHFVFALFLIWLTAVGLLRQLKDIACTGTAPPAGPALRFYFLTRPARRLLRATIFTGAIIGVFYLLYLTRTVYSAVQPVEVFRGGSSEEMVAALTFDDGPHPYYTAAILDILEEKGVKATFFLVGAHAERYPETAQKIVAAGHEIGSHTYSHANLYRRNAEKVRWEINRGHDAVAGVTGVKPALFRPPRGLYNDGTLEACADQDLTLVLWTVSSRDWLELPVQDIVRQVSRQVLPGAILLFHDSGDIIHSDRGCRINTVRALPGVIDALRDKGYSFLTVGEMMAREQAGLEAEE